MLSGSSSDFRDGARRTPASERKRSSPCGCNCYSEDDSAPTWLVYDRAVDGGIEWCRVPDRTEPLELVHAKDTAGDHTSPADVLLWLQRREADPWLGSGNGNGNVSDAVVLEALRDKILAG